MFTMWITRIELTKAHDEMFRSVTCLLTRSIFPL